MSTIPVSESVAGFIASDPTHVEFPSGAHQVYFRIGIPRYTRDADGRPRALDPAWADMVLWGQQASAAAAAFKPGDYFVASGATETYPTDAGDRQRFVARRIGHDVTRPHARRGSQRSGNHPAGRALGVDAEPPGPPAQTEVPPSGPRLRVVPDLPAQRTPVRHASALPPVPPPPAARPGAVGPEL